MEPPGHSLQGNQGQWAQQSVQQPYRSSLETPLGHNSWSTSDNSILENFRPNYNSFPSCEANVPETLTQNAPDFHQTIGTLPPPRPPPPSHLTHNGLSDSGELIDALTSKSSSAANFLQFQEPVPARPLKNQANPSQKRRARAPRNHRISPADWKKYYGHIRKLYLEKNKTALEIMRSMERDFNFTASYVYHLGRYKPASLTN
jgi:hypothetical protein